MRPFDFPRPDLPASAPEAIPRLAGESATRDAQSLGVELAGIYDSGAGEGGSEVVAVFDGRLYVTNGAQDRIDIFDAETGALLDSIDLAGIEGYDGLQSVDVTEAGIAVAVDIANLDPATPSNGVVARFDVETLELIDTVEVGNLPDQLVYSADGTMIFVANEGERQAEADPAGSISIVDVATGAAQTFGFEAFDGQVDALREAGVRIFPGALPSTDFEPEYIAEAGGKLFVTLQEANAVAIFGLATMSWDRIVPLGTQDHSLVGLDASDEDGAIDIQTYENLVGLRMPDAIAATEIDGETYFLTANEGDDRGDFDEGGDAARVGDILAGDVAGLSIDASVDTTGLERLTVSIIDGDTDGDGDIDVLHSYGARSFTIYDLDGNVVFDSGDDFEQIIAANRVPNAFNNDDFALDPSEDPNEIDENRSDNKGPEPEAITVGQIGEHVFAFIGLERDGGIMIYDITDPANASFVDYIDAAGDGNVSPEIVEFIPADEATGTPARLAVSFEVSGTTAIYDLELGREISGGNGKDDIAGTIGEDVLSGGNGKDVIEGRGGDDVIEGGNGKDMLSGGAGDDEIHGGTGKDLIHGGMGDDVLTGGAGPDTFMFQAGDGTDEITDFGRADVIDLSATGLSFADLAITEMPDGTTEIVYGEDSILVTTRFGQTIDEGDFVF